MSLFAELKRRNVFRVGVLYLVSSWLLLQLTDVLSSLLTVPQWVGSVVILMLVLGFFPATIFAWVYEMTPEGLKRESQVDRTHSITDGTGHKINKVIVVLLVLAIAGLIADRLVPETTDFVAVTTESSGAPVTVPELSIAVLPFADLSADQDQKYFTDGLSEELLNLLVRVDGLHVASRTSSFAFRDSSIGIPAISRELNVGHILEGSVRKDGARIRITAQLIEAGSDRHLWSENFDRELVDIFAIQDEIANAIVQALTGKMGVEEATHINVEVATDNLDAYEMYLKAREFFVHRIKLGESASLFRRAIELDPEFVRAWEGLAATEIVSNDWIFDDGINHAPLAKEAALRALELNPELSMARAVLGLHATDYGSDYLSGLDYLDEAVERDKKNTTALLWRGLSLKQLGFLDKAISDLKSCLEIDPMYQNCRQHLASVYLMKGDTDRAVELLELTLEYGFHSITENFVSYFVRNDRRYLTMLIADIKTALDAAPVVEWIRAVENPDADNSAGLARLEDWASSSDTGRKLADIPDIYVSFRAYDELEKNGVTSRWILWHPDSAEFRGSPQFKRLVRAIGLVDYWFERGFPSQCRPLNDNDFECDQELEFL
jgi:TolB-like protein